MGQDAAVHDVTWTSTPRGRRSPLVGAGVLGDAGPEGARGSWEITAHLGEAPRSLEPAVGTSLSLAPRLEMGGHIAMCITLGYMLILML